MSFMYRPNNLNLIIPLFITKPKVEEYLYSSVAEFFLFCLRVDLYVKLHLFFIYLFFFIISFFSLLLIFISNPIYSVISLIIVYFFTSFILICIEVHFLAVVFILIYLGAVIVLFLFIVMMLNVKVQNSVKIFNIIPLLFLIIMFFIFFKNIFDLNQSDFSDYYFQEDNYKDFLILDFFSLLKSFYIFKSVDFIYYIMLKQENYILFSILLYNYFYIEIILASFILLLAMIGCISITLIHDFELKKKQEPMEQLLHSDLFFKKTN